MLGVEGVQFGQQAHRLTATFTDDSTLVLTPDLVGPAATRNAGIIGEAVDCRLGQDELLEAAHIFCPTVTRWASR